jgi:hypothetical protein
MNLLAWQKIEELNEICDFPIKFGAQKTGACILDIVKEHIKVVADNNIEAFIASLNGGAKRSRWWAYFRFLYRAQRL